MAASSREVAEATAAEPESGAAPSAGSSLRVEAAEFVPGRSQAGADGKPLASVLSASSPEFVPGQEMFGHGVSYSNGYLPAEMEHTYTGGEAKDGAGSSAEAYDTSELEPVDMETFLTPQPLEREETDTGSLRVEGRRLHWDVPGEWEELRLMPHGECLTSPRFCVAGSFPLQLTLFPTGAALTEAGNSAVGLVCEEKAKLKFELFFISKSSGMKVMLGKRFSCDFRQPELSHGSTVTVGVEVHENLLWTGFVC